MRRGNDAISHHRTRDSDAGQGVSLIVRYEHGHGAGRRCAHQTLDPAIHADDESAWIAGSDPGTDKRRCPRDPFMARVVPSQIVALINKCFPVLKSATTDVDHGSVPMLMAVANLVGEIPTELLTISGDDYSDLVCGVESIKNSVAFWQHKGVGAIGNPGIRGTNTLLVIRDVLAKCPDQIPSPRTAELAFITDTALRESIRLDISTATSSLHSGEWKGATVLAGAATEALLLWAIQENEGKNSGATQNAISTLTTSGTLRNRPNTNPERWDFFELIEISASLKLIRADTASQARLGRNFRNLIHPGRAARLGLVCDRGTALSALATVELVARDLS